MRVLQVLLKVDLELCLEGLQRCQSARCKDDGSGLQLLNLVETYTGIEAEEFKDPVLYGLG